MSINISTTQSQFAWPTIDKIYRNAKTLDPKDEVMIGRFVMIQYTSPLFIGDERERIEAGDYEVGSEEQIYWENFLADSRVNYDRTIFQKRALKQRDGTYNIVYVPICNLLTPIALTYTWENV